MPKIQRIYLGTSLTGNLSTVCEKRWFCRLCKDSSSWRYRDGPLPEHNITIKKRSELNVQKVRKLVITFAYFLQTSS